MLQETPTVNDVGLRKGCINFLAFRILKQEGHCSWKPEICSRMMHLKFDMFLIKTLNRILESETEESEKQSS